MRWEEQLFAVFDDLEQQAEGLALVERDTEVAELGRAGYAEVDLVARLHASVGAEVGVDLAGADAVRGRLCRVGTDWCLLAAGSLEWVVRLSAVTSVRGLSDRALGPEARGLGARLGLGSALRGVAEGRHEVVLHRIDGRRLEGVLGRVGADFVEVSGRAGDAVAGTVAVPFAAVAAVCRR
jgi:hypothetical protein